MSNRTLTASIAAVAALALVAGCADRKPTTDTDTAAAVRAGILTPNALATDADGNLYIADAANHVIDKLTPDGTLTVVAGVPGNGAAIVPGPATSSPLSNPSGLAVDSSGNLYVADTGSSQVVASVSATTKELSVVAGVLGEKGPLSPGPATSSDLASPSGLALDGAGNLYIADQIHFAVDKVDPSGNLSVVAGMPGSLGAPSPGPATDAALYAPTGVAVDDAGNLYIADGGNHVVEKVDPSGALTLLAGTPGSGGYPTPGPAKDSLLGTPSGVAVDTSGTVYIADPDNDVVEAVAPDGTLSIVAGTGDRGAPTPGPATDSTLHSPGAVAVDDAGNLFIADTGNNVVEKVTPDGALTVVAGNGRTTPMLKILVLANDAVSSRLQYVQRLIPAVQAAQWLTDENKATALALLEGDQDTLLELGGRLASDTNPSALYADYKALFRTLRVFALALPQVYLAGAADDLYFGALPPLTDAFQQLRALLDGPNSGQDTRRIEAKMTDLNAQITTINTTMNGLAAQLLAYTPDQSLADPHLLRPARTAIKAATAAATRGNADIVFVEEALGVTLDASPHGPIGSASRIATQDLGAADRSLTLPDTPVKVPGA